MNDKFQNTESGKTSNLNMRHPSNSEDIEKSSTSPALLLFWIWNWFTALPKTVTNMFTDFKNSEFLSKFSVLDAMMQFIFAVATSCHPQEDGFDGEEYKSEKPSPAKSKGDLKVFSGTGRSLRSRTVDVAS